MINKKFASSIKFRVLEIVVLVLGAVFFVCMGSLIASYVGHRKTILWISEIVYLIVFFFGCEKLRRHYH